MVTLTITELGVPKDRQTKYGPKPVNWVKAAEHGSTYLGYWVNSANQGWKVGDKVEVESVTSREYNGKTYWDIKMPKGSGGMPSDVLKYLETIISGQNMMKLHVAELVEWKRSLEKTENKITGTDIDYPEDNGTDEGIPF